MRSKIIIAGTSGLIGVALGAFGAHGLKTLLNSDMLEIYRTGILYHLIHSAVLLAIAFTDKKEFSSSFYFILCGVLLFSFSLYFYSLTAIKLFAFITPLGGVSFLIGWSLIILQGIKLKSKII
jgi:uncharacterized membrane protein YgdD (TMEM256/DUF423 family)